MGDCFEDIEKSVGKAKRTSLDEQQRDSLLAICEQKAPMMLSAVFCKYCDLQNIVKVGEGTYGEVFKAGNRVYKIVPFDGDLRVNGEIQKKAEELLVEAVLSKKLNRLRGRHGFVSNLCSTFIETIELRVCQGSYDGALIKAWEDWDGKHGSENDHPKGFPEKQARAKAVGVTKDRTVFLQFAMDTRNKIDPPPPKNFSGNAYGLASVAFTMAELEESTHESIADKIRQAKNSVTGLYVGEYMKALEGSNGNLPPLKEHTIVSDWRRFPFHKVGFLGNDAAYASPLVPLLPQVAYLMQNPNEAKGIDLRIGLLPNIESLFSYYFLKGMQ